MTHHHFKHIRNIFIVLIALMIAGYPYLIFTGYIFQNNEELIQRGILMLVVLLLSFGGVAYAAHREFEKRKNSPQR